MKGYPDEVLAVAETAGLGSERGWFPQRQAAADLGNGLSGRAARWAAENAVNREMVYVFDHGVVWWKRKKAFDQGPEWDAQRIETFRWSDVVLFRQEIVQKNRNAPSYKITHAYQFTLADARVLAIRCHGEHAPLRAVVYSGLEHFAAVVDPLVTSAQIPGAEESLRNGGKVACGVFDVDRQGIHRRSKFLPWTELEAIRIANGYIAVKQRGKFLKWASHTVAAVENRSLFLAIARSMSEKHGAQLP